MSIQKNKIEQHKNQVLKTYKQTSTTKIELNIWRGNSMSQRFQPSVLAGNRFRPLVFTPKLPGFCFFKNESNLLYLLSEIE